MVSKLTRLPLEPPVSARATESAITLFARWFEQAKQTSNKEPSAMFLATASQCGAPSCRVVLLKAFDDAGFVFYTNTNSRKGRDINKNSQAAICFYWPETSRQIRIEGHVSRVSDEEADAYFSGRSLKSRIGAWASHQSEPMQGRAELLKRVAYYTAKWATGAIERPPHWTGFRIVPDYFEFWDGTDHTIPERKVFYLREEVWYGATLQP